MAYLVYLDKVLLPITPAKIKLKIKNKNETLDLINHGEVNILKDAGLTEITFDARIPLTKYPFAVYKDGFKDAKYFQDEIEKLKTSKKPFQFIVSRTAPNGTVLFYTNIKVSLEDYDIDEDAEDNNDLTIPLTLKQYKDYTTKKIVVKKPDSSGSKPSANVDNKRPNSSNKPSGKTHTVKKGDSLWSICKSKLGNGSKSTYDKVYRLNKELMDKYNKKYKTSKYTIYPGQVLRLE